MSAGSAAGAAGQITQFTNLGAGTADQPSGVTAGSDGDIWFTGNLNTGGSEIGRITPTGTVTDCTAGLPSGSNLGG